MKKKVIFSSFLLIIVIFASHFFVNSNTIKTSNTIKNIHNINIEKIWEKTLGDENIIIGIIDSGIDISCDEIKQSIYANKDEVPDNEKDDDNNGYINDINGWNFYDNSNEVFTNFSSDFHGTMIAGIIAGSHTDNGKFGIAPNVKILPLKCFRGTKGDTNDVIKAIEYGYDLGVRIFNCSWDTSTYSEKLFNIIKKYDDAIFICSGGKQAQDLSKDSVYPACFDLDNIICVGAIDNEGNIYQYSGFGDDIDIYAPGENIYCIMPGSKYTYSNGTSLSTAYVTGSVALVKSKFPELNVNDIKILFSKSSTDSSELNHLDVDTIFNNAKELIN